MTLFPTDDQYIELAEKTADFVEKIAKDKFSHFPHHDFTLNSSTEEVKIFSGAPTEVPGAEENMLKMNTILHAPMEKVFDHLVPFGAKRREWDVQIEEQELLESLPGDVYVVYTKYKAVEHLPARTAVTVFKVRRSADEVIVAGTSTTHRRRPQAAPQTAHYHFIGYRLKAAGPAYTKLRVFWCADLRLARGAPPAFKHELLAQFVHHLIASGVPSINPSVVE